MTIRFVLVLLIVKQILSAGTATISVSLADYKINAATNYTWTIAFPNSVARTYMTFTFPSGVATSSNSVASIGSSNFIPTSMNGNSLTISTSSVSITSTMIIIITNIVNPSSAFTSVKTFYFNSDQDNNIALDPITAINYLPGNLNSCSWTFNKCTEQYNSLLTINISTSSPIPSGSQTISVGFPTVWSNHYNKSPVYGVSSLSCSLSFNGGATISSGVTCSYNPTSITISYSISSPVNASSIIVIYIQGVTSPPTVNTPSSTFYTTKTADSSGNTIDGIASGSACSIAPVCVTNYSVGTFTPSSPLVNSQITGLKTVFTFYPTITFINSDVVEIYYS